MPPRNQLKKGKKEKRVARAASRQKVIVRAHKTLTRNKLVGYCQRWLRWSEKERAENLVLKDHAAVAAHAYYTQIDEDELRAIAIAAKTIAAHKVRGATSFTASRKRLERRRSALKYKIVVTSAQLTRPVDPRVVAGTAIWMDYANDHPCSAKGQILAPILAAKQGTLEAIARNKQVVWAYMPMGPQRDDADVAWSWRKVLPLAFSPCLNYICVAPHPDDGHVGFGGGWSCTVGISLPFNKETPLVWILPKGYNHDDRASNYAERNQ